MDAQSAETNPDPNKDANFIQIVTNGIRDSTMRSKVREKRSNTLNDLRDNWRRAVSDFEIDKSVGGIDTRNISELSKPPQAPKNQQSQGLQPCFSCRSTAHKVADCPISASNINKKVQQALAKLRGGRGGGGARNRRGQRGGQRGGKSRGTGSFPSTSGKVVKPEPKN